MRLCWRRYSSMGFGKWSFTWGPASHVHAAVSSGASSREPWPRSKVSSPPRAGHRRSCVRTIPAPRTTPRRFRAIPGIDSLPHCLALVGGAWNRRLRGGAGGRSWSRSGGSTAERSGNGCSGPHAEECLRSIRAARGARYASTCVPRAPWYAARTAPRSKFSPPTIFAPSAALASTPAFPGPCASFPSGREAKAPRADSDRSSLSTKRSACIAEARSGRPCNRRRSVLAAGETGRLPNAPNQCSDAQRNRGRSSARRHPHLPRSCASHRVRTDGRLRPIAAEAATGGQASSLPRRAGRPRPLSLLGPPASESSRGATILQPAGPCG